MISFTRECEAHKCTACASGPIAGGKHILRLIRSKSKDPDDQVTSTAFSVVGRVYWLSSADTNNGRLPEGHARIGLDISERNV